jgi:hypothetical protein
LRNWLTPPEATYLTAAMAEQAFQLTLIHVLDVKGYVAAH